MLTYRSGMEFHLEFLQVKPVFGLTGVKVMIKVTCCIAKTVELSIWGEQDCGGSLLIGHTRVSTFPAPKVDSQISIHVPSIFISALYRPLWREAHFNCHSFGALPTCFVTRLQSSATLRRRYKKPLFLLYARAQHNSSWSWILQHYEASHYVS